MSERPFHEIESTFHELRALPAQERARRLAQCAARDPDLAAEVGRLLVLDGGESDLDGRAWGPSTSGGPGRIGSWRLEERLASGSMGLVWLASRDEESFHQRAALKILSPLLADTDFERRFRVERALLASLEHPNVARFLDGGVTDDRAALPGLPFMAIEFVDGPPIHDYCREQELGARERVQLFLQVLEAVDSAHCAMILHRDLKPANVLVERSSGTVKVLDFGVAMLLAEGSPELGTAPELATRIDLFTPAYASPEQLLGRTLDRTSDVYSLGVMLHELVAERHPFASERAGGLEAVLERSERPPPALDDADLARVSAKAMSPEAADRYPSTRAFAEDLQRWLAGRPVLARPVGPVLRGIKFARRNPALTAALALASIGILSAVLGLGIGVRRADRARQAAEASAQVARDRREALRLLLGSLETSFRQDLRRNPEDEPVLSRLVLGTAKALDKRVSTPELRAAAAVELCRALSRLGKHEAARTVLERALELKGQIPRRQHAATRLRLARLLARMGNTEPAREQIELLLGELTGELTTAERALLTEAQLERARLAREAGAARDRGAGG